MTQNRAKRLLILVMLGGLLPVTVATCDPVTGALNFFRDDDSDSYDYGYGCCGEIYVPICDPFYGCY